MWKPSDDFARLVMLRDAILDTGGAVGCGVIAVAAILGARCSTVEAVFRTHGSDGAATTADQLGRVLADFGLHMRLGYLPDEDEDHPPLDWVLRFCPDDTAMLIVVGDGGVAHRDGGWPHWIAVYGGMRADSATWGRWREWFDYGVDEPVREVWLVENRAGG